MPKRTRLALAFFAFAAALVTTGFLAGYLVYYRGRLGPTATEAALRTDAMRRVHCVRGWRRLSTWTYVCTIQWRDGTHVSGHVEVGARRVTNEEVLP